MNKPPRNRPRPSGRVARRAARGTARLLGERVSIALAIRAHHGKDESYFPDALPDAVVFPHSTEEVRDVVARLPAPSRADDPVRRRHLARGPCPRRSRAGSRIDMSGMNKVLRVSGEDLDATVQAGVTRKQLNEEIRHTGLFFPVDPGADASLGGMAATRASGTNAVRYGTMRENVLALTVVTADGRIMRTARRARKSAAGYDLTRTVRRLRGHARHHYRSHRAPVRSTRSDVGRDLLVRGHRRRRAHGDPDPASRHPDRAQRGAVRDDDEGDQRPQQDHLSGAADAVPRVPRQRRERRRAGRSWCRRSPRENGGEGFEWATKTGGPQPALECAPSGLLRLPATAPGHARGVDRRLRADLAAHRVHRRDARRTSSARRCRSRCSATSATATSTA